MIRTVVLAQDQRTKFVNQFVLAFRIIVPKILTEHLKKLLFSTLLNLEPDSH